MFDSTVSLHALPATSNNFLSPFRLVGSFNFIYYFPNLPPTQRDVCQNNASDCLLVLSVCHLDFNLKLRPHGLGDKYQDSISQSSRLLPNLSLHPNIQKVTKDACFNQTMQNVGEFSV